MNKTAKQRFDTAAEMLQSAINNASGIHDPSNPGWCEPSVAQNIVLCIAGGIMAWVAEPTVVAVTPGPLGLDDYPEKAGDEENAADPWPTIRGQST
jgi:hypothetical protein